MKSLLVWAAMSLVMFGPAAARAQEKTESASSAIPTKTFQDALLDKMAGKWKLGGRFEGQPINHSVEVDWVLNHQFLRIHEKDLNPAKPGEAAYEATLFVGYEPASKRYVAHWIDVFGGGASTLGYGKLSGDAVEFLFDYPGQPWRTTFRWQPESRSWVWLMSAKDMTGEWKEVANMPLTRAGAH
jgi:hypothetical protein